MQVCAAQIKRNLHRAMEIGEGALGTDHQVPTDKGPHPVILEVDLGDPDTALNIHLKVRAADSLATQK